MPELNSFEVPLRQLKQVEPIPYANIDEIIYVDDEDSLSNMITDLKEAKEIAIDSQVREAEYG